MASALPCARRARREGGVKALECASGCVRAGLGWIWRWRGGRGGGGERGAGGERARGGALVWRRKPASVYVTCRGGHSTQVRSAHVTT